ncbi:MAG: histidine--tRNA ligase [Nitrospirae bacterium]|nr:histidine--tRNA ligase [Nitrospirota bacterium]
MSKYNTLKGVADIYTPDIHIWHTIENTAKEVFALYGFNEIRIPIIEYTEVFTRSIGQSTDIVEKEMYTFNDRGGRSISLRPEGTASVVRCYVQNNLHTLPSPQKFYYNGAMFRYERPQKGRFRQFYQIGAEVFGSVSPMMDAEMLSMLNELLSRLKLNDTTLEINSIGCKQCRPSFRSAIQAFFLAKEEALCADCKVRLNNNPLRLLDCKNETCANIRNGHPNILDYICSGCKGHHKRVKELLNALGVSFVENPMIVRGLDYYTKTTFEVTTQHLGAQKAIIAGGRYDNLVEEFGGPAVPAIGFAIGMERMAELLRESYAGCQVSQKLYFAPLCEKAETMSLSLCEKLRVKGISVVCGEGDLSLKRHLKKADKLNVIFVIIIGEDEIVKGKATWRRLSDGQQGVIDIDTVEGYTSLIQGNTTR